MKIHHVDQFASASDETQYTSFLFVDNVAEGTELLYVGSNNGSVNCFDVSKRLSRHNLRPDDIAKEYKHTATVTCILFLKNNPKLTSNGKGILVTGSSDRNIKLWSPTAAAFNQKPLIQTLTGHTGGISEVVDGQDGTLLSCGLDGGVRVWTPQRGRDLMLHPYLDCTFSCTTSIMPLTSSMILDGGSLTPPSSWLTSMVINSLGTWSCYIGDMSGTIDVYRKGTSSNDVDIHVSSFVGGQMSRYSRWEHVHKLGISKLILAPEPNYLVSLSFDGTCKVLDAVLGQAIFVIPNPRRNPHGGMVMYTGVVWSSEDMSLSLVDEVGSLDVFSTFLERVVDTASQIVSTSAGSSGSSNSQSATTSRSSSLMKSTASLQGKSSKIASAPNQKNTPLLGPICCYSMTKKSPKDSDPDDILADEEDAAHLTGGHSKKRYYLVLLPAQGKMLMFGSVSNFQCTTFRGHEGNIVGFGLNPFIEQHHHHLHHHHHANHQTKKVVRI